ncbi:hypothetical protein T492DRAFT_886630 [Pavlovales sp. CCMP2436]|nr:hypothetical protein T492DRAFT_886630 [Pavlovales sp. CCMP2436]
MLALFLALVARLPPPGSVGVWVYDHPTAWPAAQWASTVDAFNVNASSGRQISNAVIYGSDMEIYDGSWCCSPSSQEVMGTRIARYGQDPKTDVTLIVDGRMDGGEDWSPNLARLSPVQLEVGSQ